MTMTLVEILITYVACLVVFLAVDFVWLGWIAKPIYHRQLDALLRKRVKWPGVDSHRYYIECFSRPGDLLAFFADDGGHAGRPVRVFYLHHLRVDQLCPDPKMACRPGTDGHRLGGCPVRHRRLLRLPCGPLVADVRGRLSEVCFSVPAC